MKIVIFGASGSGTTTLAHQLELLSGFYHLDADDYYWLKSERPFEQKRDRQERNDLFIHDFKLHNDVVVSGSIFNWDEQFFNFFDLAVFLWVPPSIRIKRLIDREIERYGESLKTDEYRKKKHHEFIDWSIGYDHTGFPNRIFELHTGWMNKLQTPLIRIEGEISIDNRLKTVTQKIKSLTIHQELTFQEQKEIDQTLYDLLLLADPSIEEIKSYIYESQIFIASYRTNTIGVFVLLALDQNIIEIRNIAIKTDYQGIGLGKRLLEKATAISKNRGFSTLRIATGNSSIGQLALYQKEGFELIDMIHNFFTDHYTNPIFENGIQCKHLLLLEKSI
ncbi:GNAT family N-acetyltransferase [Pedobacter sp. PAMC26386]|nr:GNAT family N-acetyltransferase [Pedobacter sp. PAMC26386]